MSYHTPNENSVMSILSESRCEIKARKIGQKATNFRFVPWVGIEPTLPRKLDFESSASTSSATKACYERKCRNLFAPSKTNIEVEFIQAHKKIIHLHPCKTTDSLKWPK